MRPELDRDYTLEEVADALGMSTRWVRDRIRLDGAAHQRYGRLIRFTAEQVAALRAAHASQRAGHHWPGQGKARHELAQR